MTGGIDPPTQAQVQIDLDKTRYQRGEPFKATLTEDLGWGYDLSLTLFDLTLPTSLPTGQYCLYGILSPEQNDVFETKDKGLWVFGQQCFEVF